ncbi:MAG: hypothetical protein HC879_01795 [Leptolyngbyaceae cyanobacterium SL_5_9]|nr:hypothetical protein [Leptolyngbyaceae cyanobacterium SL_5_9]NJO73136.1 hypothetical protein [Leptolyngbyaceae cyanobacterium RM1_406_9]
MHSLILPDLTLLMLNFILGLHSCELESLIETDKFSLCLSLMHHLKEQAIYWRSPLPSGNFWQKLE